MWPGRLTKQVQTKASLLDSQHDATDSSKLPPQPLPRRARREDAAADDSLLGRLVDPRREEPVRQDEQRRPRVDAPCEPVLGEKALAQCVELREHLLDARVRGVEEIG